jgi:hypothetical protein
MTLLPRAGRRAVGAAGAALLGALAAAAPAAAAGNRPDPAVPAAAPVDLTGAETGAKEGLHTLTAVPLYPVGGSAVDPFHTSGASLSTDTGLPAVDSRRLTAPLSEGGRMGDVPLAGRAVGGLTR